MSINSIGKLSIISIVASSLLYAQETRLETVTVTANKMEENIQDVPQSVTVLDAQIIEEKGIKNVEDIIREIPNMKGLPFTGGIFLTFRGLGYSVFTSNNPVIIYIDGVATSNKLGFDASLVDVERVEVLRGPQGTLFGKDAIGAVINVVTKEPTNETTGFVGAEYGSHNYMRGVFNIKTPFIDDKLFFALNGEADKDDGWITNDFDGDEKVSKESDYRFSTSLKYNINDKLSAKIIVKRERKKEGVGNDLVLINSSGLDDFTRDKLEHVNIDVPISSQTDISSQTLDIAYSADNFTFKSVTTHREVKYDGIFDIEKTNHPAYMGLEMFWNEEISAYSQEFRVSSNNEEGLRWIGGVYLDKEKKDTKSMGQEFPMFDPAPPHNFWGNFYMDAPSIVDSETQAVFGQTMIPFAKKFELTLGGRLQRVTKEIDLEMFMAPIGVTAPAMNVFKDKKTWNAFLPKVALSYEIDESFTTYMSISKGYMPGGHNMFAMSAVVEDNRFEPQQSTNYEIGIKGVLENLIFSAAIFRMDIEDIHVFKTLGPGVFITDNAEKAHSQGVEFDFSYFVSDSIEISGALGFIDAKYDDYFDGVNSYDGKNIENNPSHTANLGVSYRHPSGYYGRVDVRNEGSIHFFDNANKEFIKYGGHTEVDMKVGYKVSQFDIYGYVRNLTDEDYITVYGLHTPSVGRLATLNDPRTFGVGVRYKF